MGIRGDSSIFGRYIFVFPQEQVWPTTAALWAEPAFPDTNCICSLDFVWAFSGCHNSPSVLGAATHLFWIDVGVDLGIQVKSNIIWTSTWFWTKAKILIVQDVLTTMEVMVDAFEVLNGNACVKDAIFKPMRIYSCRGYRRLRVSHDEEQVGIFTVETSVYNK